MPQVVAVAAAWVAKTITVKAVTAFVVKTVLQIAATVALSKAAKALGLSKQSMQERQASVTQLSLGEVPREAVFGLACTGGSLLDAFNFGGKYGTDTVTRVIELADHLLDGIVGYYVDDVYCAWTGDGVQPGFNGKLSIEFKNGFAAGNVPPPHVRQNGGWSASDVLAGVAHVVVDTRFDDTVWTQGHPRFKFVVRGLRVYDPRRDPALGYTGPNPQTWADTSTHTFSRNAALLRYAYTRGIYATGHQGEPQHLLIGRGLSAEEAPPARIIAAANLCDEAVDGEIRYTADGVISANQAYIEVEELFAAAMAGVIVQREGGVEIEPGQAKATVVTITDGDLVIGKTIGATPFLPDSDGGRINTIVPRYVEPTQGWLDHAAPVIRDLSRMAPAPVGDGGPREMTLALALVIRAVQANSNGAIALRKAALERRAAITLPPRFAGLEEGDWIAWKSDRRHGGATVRYRVVSFSLSAEWQNSLVLEEIASSVYGVPDPVEDRALPPPAPTPIDALQLFGVQAEAITLAGETSTVPAVRFSWDVTTADTAMTAIRAEVRRVGETDAAPTRIDDVAKGQANVTNGVGPDQALECRLVPLGDPSKPVLASNWITVSTSTIVAGDLSPESPVVKRFDEILLDVEDLIETFGSTEAAAVSAAAADTARALAEAAKQAAIDAKTESAAQAVASQTARQGSEAAAGASVASAQTSSSKADEAGQKAAAAEVSRAAAETQRALAEAARTTSVGASETALGASAQAIEARNQAAQIVGDAGTLRAAIDDESATRATETAALATRQSVTEAKLIINPNLFPNGRFQNRLPGYGGGFWRYGDNRLGSFAEINSVDAGSAGNIDIYDMPQNLTNLAPGELITLSAQAFLSTVRDGPGQNYGIRAQVLWYRTSDQSFVGVGNEIAWGLAGDPLGFGAWITKQLTYAAPFPAGGGTVFPRLRIYAYGRVYGAITSMKVENGSSATLYSDDAGILTLAAGVRDNTGALVEQSGKLQAWSQKTVVAGDGKVFVEMRATDNNGNVTADIMMGARRIGLLNEVGGGYLPALEAEGGRVKFAAPISIIQGGRRTSLGPGFGAGNDLHLWSGPSGIAYGGETIDNGILGISATDGFFGGKTYSGPFDSGAASATAIDLSVGTVFASVPSKLMLAQGFLSAAVNYDIFISGSGAGDDPPNFNVTVELAITNQDGSGSVVVFSQFGEYPRNVWTPISFTVPMATINTTKGDKKIVLRAVAFGVSVRTPRARNGLIRGLYGA